MDLLTRFGGLFLHNDGLSQSFRARVYAQRT